MHVKIALMKILFRIFFIGCPLMVASQQNLSEFHSLKKETGLPIKVSRTISFTTDEGSYMDVQISPDGKTILFDMLGSLFLMPANGGTAKQITRGLAVNRSPAWSPNGKAIAFSSDASGERRLHIIDIDGNDDHVYDRSAFLSGDLDYGKPQWLPDNKFILFGASLYSLEGNKIDFKDMFKVNEPIIGFSDSGAFFYTERHAVEGVIISRFDMKSLQKKNASILKHSLIENDVNVSANGHWLTYLERSEEDKDTTKLIAYNIDDGKERILALISVEHPLYSYPQYSISPDSKNVFIGFGGKIHKIELDSGKDEIVPFNATIKVDMGALDYNTFSVSYDSLKVSYTRSANANPEETQLVFSALNKVYIMDLPSGKPRVLASQKEGQFCPSFSPDGKWIAYVTWIDTVGGQIWRVPSRGGKPEQLTHTTARYQYLNWSPDGKQIVVVKGDLGDASNVDEPYQGQIITVNVNSGKEQLIADSVPFYNSPAFTADGSAVTYMLISKANKQTIVKKQLDSLHFKVLATVMNGKAFRQLVVSPDQRFIVYTANENLFLVPLLDGSRPTVIEDKESLCPSIRFSEGGFDPHWEQGGKVLSWSYGKKYYRIEPDKIIVSVNKLSHNRSEAPAIAESSNIINCKVQPDRTVTINLVAPSNYAIGTLVFNNARIITIHGNEVIEHGSIVVKNGRIIAVNESDKIRAPAGAVVVDVTGKTIIPGFVDIHAHYQNSARDVFPQQSWKFLINLAYGVTTARNPSAGHDEFGYSELLQEGSLIGPRLYSSGQAIRNHYNIKSFEDAQSIVKNHVISNGTFMKQYLLDTRIQRQWLLMASMKAGLNMTNEGFDNSLEYLGLVKDGSTGVEHCPSWGNVYMDVIKFLSLSGTFFTPTLQTFHGGEANTLYFRNQYFKSIDSKLKRFTPPTVINNKISDYKPKDTFQLFTNLDAIINAKVLHEGGKIGVGSHGEYQGIGVHFEIWGLQMGGLTNMEALRCATLTGAEALGIQKNVGSIEVGKIADLIVLNNNPLEDIHNTKTIRYVVKDGIVYDGDTLDIIWPKKYIKK